MTYEEKLKKVSSIVQSNRFSRVRPFSSKDQLILRKNKLAVPKELLQFYKIVGVDKEAKVTEWDQYGIGLATPLDEFIKGDYQVFLEQLRDGKWDKSTLDQVLGKTKGYTIFFHYDHGDELAVYDNRTLQVYYLDLGKVPYNSFDMQKDDSGSVANFLLKHVTTVIENNEPRVIPTLAPPTPQTRVNIKSRLRNRFK